MDFYKIRVRERGKTQEIYPDFIVKKSKDLMARGRHFYAIWHSELGMWSTDEYDVALLVDKELREYAENYFREEAVVKWMGAYSSRSWANFQSYLKDIPDSSHSLDDKLTFQNTEITRGDYISKRLPYALEEGSISAWDELIGTLYLPEERQKIEWAIGSIVAGDSKHIQKFVVLFGEAGGGKSTVLNIIQKLFEGYYTTFEAKALTTSGNSFSTEAFKGNPLVAIQHDGDLSQIEDNTKLNSIVSHEEVVINEKFKPSYPARLNCFLFMGTNKPVKITDAKSGTIRRLIDVRTSGNKVPNKRYHVLMSQIDFELGAIAYHCLKVYNEMGKNYYSGYKPLEMMYQTDIFFNFVEANFSVFRMSEYINLARAYEMYKAYCEESNVEFRLPRHKFREELKNYFAKYDDRTRIDGQQVRSIYSGFLTDKFTSVSKNDDDEPPISLTLDSDTSLFDDLAKEYPAQYASEIDLLPLRKWVNVDTKLGDLDTTKLHFVKLPLNHIVIDFDLTNENGEKSAEKNLEAASEFPPTYAEYSRSHKGVHLHYIYDGDPERLARLYSEGIEIKVFKGDSSLRRQLSKCNNIPIAHISNGLPLKGEEKMIDLKTVKSEKGLRDLVVRNLNKEIHPGTKPSIDFIYKILEEAYTSGMKYDLTTLRPRVLNFAMGSTHQAEYCVDLVGKMKFQSEETELEEAPQGYADDQPIVFYDVEVFSNLFVVCWKYQGEGKECVRMINPTPEEIGGLMKMKLVGFNCRRYDNHILYGRYIGYTNEELFDLSKKIIGDSSNGMFREAYSISYTDIYDFSSEKKSLKAFQIELGIHHKELGLPWDQPVPEEKWEQVAEYCDNDVISEEAVFEARKADFIARQILAELSGLTVNDTTQQHAARIIFGADPKPQEKFVYTDLSKTFPGYVYSEGKSSYRGEDPGEGGYVYAEPGIYEDVALLDVASMHPSSIENLNLFGPYTKRFSEIKATRMAIKHKEFDKLTTGTFAAGIVDKYKESPELLDGLAYALKIVINIVYGLTSARFPNKFKDVRNVDNIVAKRGALFMIDLKHAVQEKGFVVAHIKTDSIKIPNATKDIIDFVFDFGQKYGYLFEHEATFSKFCLVNDAVYIAKYKAGKKAGKWSATGAQFQHPFVFKTLFSHEPIEFSDMCEAKSVTSPSAIYLDMNEGLEEGEHNYQFVGKVGLFCPVEPGTGGGLLMREKEGKYYAVTGTKGYRWLEAEVVKDLGLSDQIDTSYYENLVSDAIKHISKFGDFDQLVSE
jgi:uncharacterized protein DUF5906/D5 protein-like